MEAEQSAQPTGTNRSIGLRPHPAARIISGGAPAPPSRQADRRSAKRQISEDRYLRSIRHIPTKTETRSGNASQTGKVTGNSLHRLPRPASGPFRPGCCGAAFGASSMRLSPGETSFRRASRGLGRPGGHSEGQNTRSHPELGRENPQRRWYCVSRRGRVGRRQVLRRQEPRTRLQEPGFRHPLPL